ncbi:hypothetical protein U472_10490 [Orenia metallireducens]|uniref:Protein kinase domain-containing protein n=1 Tax=Orenia metallireducens TaxID=1413210 RepID=A0A1C0A881_9FIRM|nr:hypothetical protein U472_10490 [Orenia metallireducens]
MDDNPNKIKLIDFGLARPLDSKRYEKYRYKDLYLIALTCLYLIKGPLSERPINDLDIVKNNNLKDILYKGIHPNLEKRYHSVDEFIEDLKPLVK